MGKDKRLKIKEQRVKSKDSHSDFLLPKDKKILKALAKKKQEYLREIEEIDNKIVLIQDSTKTLIPQFAPLHHFFRQKSKWYYNWHLRPYASKMHWGILSIYFIGIFIAAIYASIGPPYQSVKAGACISNTSGPWNDPDTWLCDGVPQVPTSSDSVTIQSGHAITMRGAVEVLSLNISYGLLTTNNYNLTIGSGGLTIGALGTLTAGSSTITVSGNWDNSAGTFTANTSTVEFTKTSGTQTLRSGGTGAGKAFNNLTHSGGGTLQLIDYALDVNGNFSQTAGAFNPGSLAQNYAGNFSLSSGTSFFKGGKVTFDGDGSTQIWQDLTANGQDIGEVEIAGSGEDIPTLSTSGKPTCTVLTIRGVLDITDDILTLTGTGSPLQFFGGFIFTTNSTIIYTGATTIPTTIGGGMNLQYNNLTLSSTASSWSGTLTLNGNLTINAGATLLATSGYPIWIKGNWTNNGTFVAGNSAVYFNGTAAGKTIKTNGSSFYVVSITGGGEWTLEDGMSLNYLNVSNGTLKMNGNNLTVLTNISIGGGGTLSATSGNIYLGGNWSNSGNFSAGSSTVIFQGGDNSTQTISGNTTFYNFSASTASNSAGRTLQFAGGSTQTITGTFAITGYSRKVITLKSSDTHNWNINPTAASITYVNVSYSTNIGATFCATYSIDGGSNVNWYISGGSYCNFAPNSPSSLSQNKTNGTTIPLGGWINENVVKFSAFASDPNPSDTLYLCVEKEFAGTNFSNIEDACGEGVPYSGSPVAVTVTISGLADTKEYHWHARIKDASGAYSSWVSYGSNSESARDFGIDIMPELAKIDLGSSVTTPMAGLPFDIFLTLYDNHGNVATNFSDQINFSSSDKQAGFTASQYTFTKQNQGTYKQSVTLKTAGTQSISASSKDGKVIDTIYLTVSPAAASPFVSTISSDKEKIKQKEETAKVVVKIMDAFGNGLENRLVELFSTRKEDMINPKRVATDSSGIAIFYFSSGQEGESTLQASDLTDNIILLAKITIKVITPTVLEMIKESPIAQKIAKTATPIVTATAALGLLPLIAQAIPQAFHVFASVFPMLFTAAVARRKRKPWGIVFDSLTGKPIDFAIVRAFEAETGQLVQTKVTDENGRFNLLLSRGDYYVKVSKPGFIFPARIPKLKATQLTTRFGPEADIYLGQAFTIKNDDTNINLNIPLDPILSGSSLKLKARLWFKNAFDWFLISLSYASLPLLIIGAFLAALATLITESKLNLFISAFYIVLLSVYLVARRIQKVKLGFVFDSETGQPIPKAVISIFDKEYRGIKDVKVTDNHGHFSVLLQKGQYYLTVSAKGYRFPSKIAQGDYYFGKTINIKRPAFLNVSIPLDRD